MATTENKQNTASSTAKSTTKKPAAKKATTASTEKVIEKPVEEIAEKKAYKVTPKYNDIDIEQMITVRSGVNGKLIYISSRTGERFVWDEFGSEQELELRELKNAKNSSKKFFINNWFMFNEEDMWVVDYLGLGQYYKNAISIEDFDSIFDNTPDQIEAIISKLSNGQKKLASCRAKDLISSGYIDSNRVIAALENSLGVSLVER